MTPCRCESLRLKKFIPLARLRAGLLDGGCGNANGRLHCENSRLLPATPRFCRYTSCMVMHMKSSDLVYIQRIIVACVRDNPGRLNRSQLAKLLVSSRSLEMAKWEENRWNGRLRGMTRKSVTSDVDILIQQGYLALNSWELVVLGEMGKKYGE